MNWYAAKIFHQRMPRIRERLNADGTHYYVPEAIGSLLFVETDEEYLFNLSQQYAQHLWVYRNPGATTPTAIPKAEMEMFLFVCTAGEAGLTYLGDDKPEYHLGDRVRVIEGPFKGAEGHIKRIKKDRRLVVTIKGVAAVATTHIPPQFLEIVTSNTCQYPPPIKRKD